MNPTDKLAELNTLLAKWADGFAKAVVEYEGQREAALFQAKKRVEALEADIAKKDAQIAELKAKKKG